VGNLLGRVTNRKTLAALGVGMAMAGAGVATATAGFASTPTVPVNAVDRAVVPEARQASTADTPAAVTRTSTPARPQVSPTKTATTARPARTASHAKRRHRAAPETWGAVKMIVAHQTSPRAHRAPLPAMDRLTPVGKSGPQSWIPISRAQYHDAKAIVRTDLRMHMGLRSAVIAVATAMQESKLVNISYGTSDSLGLFQQRPSCGWGSPSQIMRPGYAAHAFLRALRTYQANNPGWAHQPLWQAAQGVQASGFPTAYAQWESQAAHLVASITPALV
jgi:hypothetical protein